MKKRFLFTAIILTLIDVSGTFAQINLDSLNTVWQDESEPDTIRTKALRNYIWDGFLFSNPDSAIILADELIEFAKQINNREEESNGFNYKGLSYANKSDYTRALENYTQSLKISKEIDDQIGMALTLNNMGLIYRDQGDHQKAIDYHDQSLTISEQIDYQYGKSLALGNIGIVYYKQGNYPKTLDYFNQSLKIEEQEDNQQGMARIFLNIGNIYYDQGDYPTALDYYSQSLKIMEQLGDQLRIANALHSIANVNFELKDYPTSLYNHSKSLKIYEAIGYEEGIANSLISIGNIYEKQGDYRKTLENFTLGLALYKEMGYQEGTANAHRMIGYIYFKQGDYSTALDYCKKGYDLALSVGVLEFQKNACKCIYDTYKATGTSHEALKYHELLTVLNDSLFNEESTKELTQLGMQYEFDKQNALNQAEQEKKDAIAAQELKQEKLVRNGFIGGFAIVLLFAGVFFVQRNRIGKEKERSEELLLNILPEETAKELKEKGHSDAQLIDYVTVLFTDFKGFTALSEQVTPKELVEDLHACFSEFDHICESYGVEKIKTIGDAYMAAGGLPTPNQTHATDVLKAALEMAAVVERGKADKIAQNLPFFEIRIGVHTGPVVAGIVGVKKFQYDIWGDTVNTASRMESSGEVGKVNISQTTYELLKDETQFTFESRGKIKAKGKGEIEMYFVSKA